MTEVGFSTYFHHPALSNRPWTKVHKAIFFFGAWWNAAMWPCAELRHWRPWRPWWLRPDAQVPLQKHHGRIPAMNQPIYIKSRKLASASWSPSCFSKSATVCSRDEDAVAVPLASGAKVVTFGGFKRCVASFRVAGVALRDIPTCFITCWKSFCVTGAILLRGF